MNTNNANKVLQIHIVAVHHLPDLYKDLLNGDVRAAQVARVLVAAVSRVLDAGEDAPSCGCCARPIVAKSLYRVVVVLPDVEIPVPKMSFFLCDQCASTDARASDLAYQKVAAWAGPGVKAVTHLEGGHA